MGRACLTLVGLYFGIFIFLLVVWQINKTFFWILLIFFVAFTMQQTWGVWKAYKNRPQ